tara:strand:+ start:410 stop:1120 length:711 start_codon:yes stop_codon:yes gene_type:complete
MKKRTLKKLNQLINGPKISNILTAETWLPVFNGYYNTFFDGSDSFVDYETQIDESEYKEYYKELFKAGVTYDFFQNELYQYCDFKDSYNEASEYITNALLNLENNGIILNTEYQKTVSPKEYNFTSDSINCEITYNARKLKDYINDNFEAYTKYISDRYTSCDGFSSFHSNDVNDWLDFRNLGSHSLGSVLNFVLLNIDSDAELNLYYESNINEAFSNNVEIDYTSMINDFNKKVA